MCVCMYVFLLLQNIRPANDWCCLYKETADVAQVQIMIYNNRQVLNRTYRCFSILKPRKIFGIALTYQKDTILYIGICVISNIH